MINFIAERLRQVHPSQVSFTEMQQHLDTAIAEIERLTKIEDAASRLINAINVNAPVDERIGAIVEIQRSLGWAR